MPKVSVNIACFNSARFIRETIESVLSQTYKDFEIIVIDDGSTDSTGDIVKSFGDPRIKYFYKKNEGLAETRNKAIAASSGEYIAFLDHDDLWLPRKLEMQLALFARRKNAALIFSDSYVLKRGMREQKTYFGRCHPHRGYGFEDLLFESSNFIPLPTVMVRRAVFDTIGMFDKNFKIGEEYDLFLRIARRHELDYVDEPLAVYRIHENNTSQDRELFTKEAFEIMKRWQRAEPALFRVNEERFLKKEADIFAELASFYALRSNRAAALHNFGISLAKHKNMGVAFRRWVFLLSGSSGYKIMDALTR